MNVKGVADYKKAIDPKRRMEALKSAMRKNAQLAKRQMQSQTVIAYVKGYSTGATRQSISVEERDGGMTQAIGAGMYYDPFVELGTVKMSPEPIILPTAQAIEHEVVMNVLREFEK